MAGKTILAVLFGLALFLPFEPALAHGKSIAEEIAARELFAKTNLVTLSHYSSTINHEGGLKHAVVEHQGVLKKRALEARDVDDVLNTDHGFLGDLGFPSSPLDLMVLRKDGCVLDPDSTEGPYWIQGELERQDIRDGQKGIFIRPIIQLIDTVTCKPVKDVWVELWQANATGVYSGVVANMNGAGENDLFNSETNFLRGIRRTPPNGIVYWGSIFPGTYLGRTPHLHVLVHKNHSTVKGKRMKVAHSGQLYFDQALVDEVMKVEPYRTRRREIMDAQRA